MTERPLPTTAAISEIAGISKSTASRALNNDPRISKKTRAKVWSIAEELGYAPNEIAQSLAKQRSRIIGFIVSQEPNYWYQEKIQVLVGAIAAAGMQTMIFQAPEGGDIADIVPVMLRYRLAGCIAIPTVDVSRTSIETLNRYKIPIVLLNRRVAGSDTSSVACDQESGGRAVAQFLLAGGHQRIALMAGTRTTTALAREAGFMAGLGEAGATLFRRCEGEFMFEAAYAATRALFAGRDQPDAIFAANDLMAFGVLDALREAGLRAGTDVSVVGFDNSGVAAWPSYRLTTVAQPIEYMFRRAVDLIEKKNADPERMAESVIVEGELILRHTARLPASLPRLDIPVRDAR
jgi:DNA-binding LacI/PurR family transcriptional regulator